MHLAWNTRKEPLTRFRDRQAAGRALAANLVPYGTDALDVLVLALPRGGVPVASEVAQVLGAPLDVFLVRKLGAPGHEELALGALASGGVRVMNDELVRSLRITEPEISAVAVREEEELLRRERLYRGVRPFPQVAGRTVILVDDGLATGATMRAAVAAVRQKNPERIVVGVPVASAEAYEMLRREADEVVCLETPEPFLGVSRWYERFPQTSDEEVQRLLERASREVTNP